MNSNLEGLNLIDLISEKHIILRREVEERWKMSDEEEISHTEGFLLAKLDMKRTSLAEIARQANVSRQAMYKCAKKLEDRGDLVFVVDSEHNKYTELTAKGREYCKKSKKLKEQVEKEIEGILGQEAIQMLKELLKENWIQ